MLTLGLAASYAPAMFRDPGEWGRIHEWIAGDVPQPRELEQETPDVMAAHAERIRAGFDAMRQRLVDDRIDAVIVLASDTGRVFSGAQVPQLCTYLGAEIWGSTRLAELGEPADDDIVRLRCQSELAAFLHGELVLRGFDMNYSTEVRALGQPDYGTTPAFVAPMRWLLPRGDLPVVPMYVNTQVLPAPSGRRCFAFGRALAQILEERDERVAILASGGLSHDHTGPRGGWIDEPLDRWVLDQFRRGKAERLQPMFDVLSDTLAHGGAQIRLWLMVAAAMETLGARAQIVDYLPTYHIAAGIGFAVWPAGRSREET
jgi:protocatechuate 4,5-dioxygenase beta chain